MTVLALAHALEGSLDRTVSPSCTEGRDLHIAVQRWPSSLEEEPVSQISSSLETLHTPPSFLREHADQHAG